MYSKKKKIQKLFYLNGFLNNDCQKKHKNTAFTLDDPLKETRREFQEKYKTRYHFEGTDTNYQIIIDSAEISIATKADILIYIIKLPIIDNEILTLERVIPLNHQRPDGIFESLIIYRP